MQFLKIAADFHPSCRYIDFTRREAQEWWKDRVKEALLARGAAAVWNDNNEFELRNPDTLCSLSLPAVSIKPVLTLLMVQSSVEAQLEHDPTVRPFSVCRAGFAGMQRYCQTWSGDNLTSWKTLRYNIPMGLSLALSGVSSAGHDVGGFAGPKPNEELFCRWVECCVLMPRFSIHSWNDDGSANEPWMYESVTPHVRRLLAFRAFLIPYIYHLLYLYHTRYEAITRPTFYTFPSDAATLSEDSTYMLGPSLLAAPTLTPDTQRRSVYLPSPGLLWYSMLNGEEVYEGGKCSDVECPLGTLSVFFKGGSVIPVNLEMSYVTNDWGFFIFPPAEQEESVCESVFHDDGLSPLTTESGEMWTLEVTFSAVGICIAIHSRVRELKDDCITFFLPKSEKRPPSVSLSGVLTPLSPSPSPFSSQGYNCFVYLLLI